jgi:hypothetical protein
MPLICKKKAHDGSSGIAPLILNFGTRLRLVVTFTSRSLYTRERAPVTYWTGCWVGPTEGLDVFKKRKYLSPADNRTRFLARSPPCSFKFYKNITLKNVTDRTPRKNIKTGGAFSLAGLTSSRVRHVVITDCMKLWSGVSSTVILSFTKIGRLFQKLKYLDTHRMGMKERGCGK